jgi:hypothetical protein
MLPFWTFLMNWEVLSRFSFAVVRRCGRFVAVDLTTPHRTISTSARNGGQTEHVRHLINHQSCEGSGHAAVFEFILKRGEEAYHDAFARRSDWRPTTVP